MRLVVTGLMLCVGALASWSVPAAGNDVAVTALSNVTAPSVQSVVNGDLDAQFAPRDKSDPGRDYWLRLTRAAGSAATDVAALVLHSTRAIDAEVFVKSDGGVRRVPRATALSGFLGRRDDVYVLPAELGRSQPLYAHLQAHAAAQTVSFEAAPLHAVLARGAARARMISACFGALLAVSASALLIWLVLRDKLFIYYAVLFMLQALYMAFLSGQGFDWPLLSAATPLGSFAWNVPIGLTGAVASLFTREIANLKHSSPRVHTAFGWIAVAFVVITAANAAKFAGLGAVVNAIGNFMFVGAALFTLVVCFLAWRGGNRAAGSFLLAWGLLEGFTIAAALRFLFTNELDSDRMYYYELPLSMVAAAVLIALGVADQLQAQRVALFEAERRAQTDPLTGVLNRRSLLERLETACQRAQARNLPISLLFIDLDHFKQINDSYGHQAGDACLRAIIEPIQLELRQSDVIGRYGGEEFVVILSSADATAAVPMAQRILDRVAGVRVDGFGAPITLTCSIGIASSDTLGVWGEQLVARADAAVYVAKHSGRNRFYMAAPVAA